MNKCERWVVEVVMDRVKITLAALLPTLWLMAAGQSFADPCGGHATLTTVNAFDSEFAFESGKHCPSNDPCSTDLSARRAKARIGSHSAKGIFFVTRPTTRSQVAQPTFSPNSSSVREGPRALATRWQFDCRAAPEPRAPSSVS
jgi:hypothetical protein